MLNKSKGVKFSWALYDWANSAWGTVITTFIFATYFTEVIAPNTEVGSVYWGNAIAISGLNSSSNPFDFASSKSILFTSPVISTSLI